MKKNYLLIGMALLLLIAGCASLKKLIRKPTLTYEKMTAKDISLFQSTLLFHFKLSNPNSIGAKIRTIRYNIKFNGKEFTKGDLDEGIHLPAKGDSKLELPVTLTYLELFETVSDFLKSDSVHYDLSGSVGIGPFDLPYHKEGDIPIPKLPNVSLKKVRISKLSLTGATVQVTVDLQNTNAFSVNVNKINYRLKLAGATFAQGVSETVSPISENGRSTLDIPLTVSFVKMGRSAYNLLTQSASDYELSGQMVFTIPGIGEKKFDFNQTGHIPFSR